MRYSPFKVYHLMFSFSGVVRVQEESSILDNSSQKLEKPKQTVPGPENGSPVKAPVPKARENDLQVQADLNKIM